MSVSTLEVRTLPVGQLTPAAYNPRREVAATSPAYRKLRASLERFGLVEPLVWNERTGRVVGGHLRLRILRELGVAEVPVSVVRLTDAQEKALNVVLNNHEAQGRYDPAKLAAVLDELKDLPEMADTGFDPAVLRSLRLRPVDERPADEVTGRVEVTLATDPGTFADLRPRLDELVREFDLEAHIRGA
jgi:ParB-like chromosome segregation protein Spo0J